MKTILITGGNGKIGRCVTERLREKGYNVLPMDIRPDEEFGAAYLDIRDREACIKAMEGVDIVIHLAVYYSKGRFAEEMIPTNITGTWNLYEAAYLNGVKRFIYGSSNHAVGFYRQDDELRDDIMHRPSNPYGLCKSFSELCGRYFSDRFGISVINVRIGTFPGKDGLPTSPRRCRTWLSGRDCQQLFLRCVEADESIKFLTIYGTSGNSKTDFDISRLKEQIGYEPDDDGMDYFEYAVNFKTLPRQNRSPNPYDDKMEFNFKGADAFLYNPFKNDFIWSDLDELEKRHGKKQ